LTADALPEHKFGRPGAGGPRGFKAGQGPRNVLTRVRPVRGNPRRL